MNEPSEKPSNKELCNDLFFGPTKVMHNIYTCGLLKGHKGRHKEKVVGSNPPATFSWPQA